MRVVAMRWRGLSAVLLLGLVGALLGVAAPAAALPQGFVDEAVSDVPAPTAFDFLPDGRILAASQTGELWLVAGGQRRSAPVLDLSGRVCSNSERGLLGIAVGPDGGSSVYLYYTRSDGGGCTNRVARFTLGAGDTIDPASELVLLDRIPSPGGNHNAGDLQFGTDGALYVAVGDGGTNAGTGASGGANDAARNPRSLLGKILRVSPDGPGIPATGNPYPGGANCGLTGGTTQAAAQCRETFASGFRNPFRMAFDPNVAGTRLFANDVGQGAWEEVDEVVAGADYGWNVCEGAHDNPARPGVEDCTTGAYTPPVHEYSHSVGCSSITGGAFVPRGVWPAEYDGAYLYGDFVCGKVFRVAPDGGGPPVTLLDGPSTASVVTLRFGPAEGTQALYYTTYAEGGSLRRLRFVGDGNRPPSAALSASPTSGAVPLDVAFDASASADPDGDALSYAWDFGDGSEPVTTTEPRTAHTYESAGAFQATVVVTDARGAESAPAAVRIGPGNTAPTVAIDEVPDGYAVGARLELTGSATDAQDGALPGAALSWTVTLHHDTHTHPLVPPTPGETLVFSAPPPEDLAAVPTTWLEATLTATDGAGATTTASARLDPRTVDVTLDSDPAGLTLRVNGTDLTAPVTLPSIPCYPLELDAPDQRTTEGVPMTLASWSDGGARQRSLLTPDADVQVTAAFRPGGTGEDPGGRRVPISRVSGAGRIDTAVALSAQRFPDCGGDGPLADTVVLARADAYPDALAGGPLASARRAPILLTGSTALAPGARAEIDRLGAQRAVLLGGEAALSADVEAELTAMGLAVERLSGPDRFATAAAVAAALPPSAQAYLVEGANADPARGWPDAVSVSWLAARSGTPILLTTRDELPAATAAALAQRGVTRTIVVGGTAAVAEPLLARVAGVGSSVTRVAGATRYDTARALLDGAGELSGATLYLTTGTDFPDALAAGPAVAARGGVLLPTDGRDLQSSGATADWLAQASGSLAAVVLVGGTDAIGPGVEADIAALLTAPNP